MKPFLTQSKNELIIRSCRERARFPPLLYAFDFDGTLAPLVREPDQADLNATLQKLLLQLSQLAPVAVITGRSVSDLKKRLKVKLPYLIGNHGLEGLPGSVTTLKKAAKNCKIWKRKLLASPLPAGVQIEDKRYSLAIHFRLAANKTEARRRIEEAIADLLPPPRVVGGKSIFNLVQPDAPHKGMALLKLMKSLKANRAVFVGDDTTDEDVFALKSKRIISIRVGRKKSSKAKYFIPRQSDVKRLLQYFIAHY